MTFKISITVTEETSLCVDFFPDENLSVRRNIEFDIPRERVETPTWARDMIVFDIKNSEERHLAASKVSSLLSLMYEDPSILNTRYDHESGETKKIYFKDITPAAFVDPTLGRLKYDDKVAKEFYDLPPERLRFVVEKANSYQFKRKLSPTDYQQGNMIQPGDMLCFLNMEEKDKLWVASSLNPNLGIQIYKNDIDLDEANKMFQLLNQENDGNENKSKVIILVGSEGKAVAKKIIQNYHKQIRLVVCDTLSKSWAIGTSDDRKSLELLSTCKEYFVSIVRYTERQGLWRLTTERPREGDIDCLRKCGIGLLSAQPGLPLVSYSFGIFLDPRMSQFLTGATVLEAANDVSVGIIDQVLHDGYQRRISEYYKSVPSQQTEQMMLISNLSISNKLKTFFVCHTPYPLVASNFLYHGVYATSHVEGVSNFLSYIRSVSVDSFKGKEQILPELKVRKTKCLEELLAKLSLSENS